MVPIYPSPDMPSAFAFIDAIGEQIVTIHPDGRVEVNPKYSATEAAQAFWDAVKDIVMANMTKK